MCLVSLVPLVRLPSLGDCVGFGVGEVVGPVRFLRLPLSLVPTVEIVSLSLSS